MHSGWSRRRRQGKREDAGRPSRGGDKPRVFNKKLEPQIIEASAEFIKSDPEILRLIVDSIIGVKIPRKILDDMAMETICYDPTLPREWVEAHLQPINRNVITRAIGLDPQVKVHTSSMALANSDLILLCSDGLNSMIPDDEIKRALLDNGPERVCQALIDAANNAGGHDNTTVAIAAIGAPPDRPKSTRNIGADQDTQEVVASYSWLKKVARAISRRR